MAWWHAFGIGRSRLPEPTPAPKHQRQAVTAAAAPVPTPRSEFLRTADAWQDEAWGYYDSLGEFRYAVEWESNMLSRVRLYAAKLQAGEDEPVRATAGPAVDMMTIFGGGVAGQSQLMANLGTQLTVPGEGYLIGEEIDGVERWTVRSVEEVRAVNRRFEVVDETVVSGTRWRPLGGNSLVNRVWRPHKRWFHVADSPARAARSTMRELELVNRYILSQYLSRLASAGVVVFPDEITFPVREEFAEADDPFMAEWIEIAAEAISKPGTASAVVPIPIRVPAEFVDAIKHVDFTLKLDEKILDKRDSAIKRLATQVNIPAEVLLGMGDVNHWGAWQLEEGALKTNIAPDAELICQAVTLGYLQPRLRASGVRDWAQWVVWYDMSELTLRPDRSADAFQAYDRLEINGAALRRETGFDESDKPKGDELREQGLKIIIKTLPSGAGSALSQLTGDDVVITPVAAAPPGEAPEQAPPDAPQQEQRTEPADDQPPSALDAAQARTDRLVRQAKTLHAVRFTLGRPPDLLHPASCGEHAYSCPFTHATRALATIPRPGTSGVYEARLDAFGRLTIGRQAPLMDTTGFLTTRSTRDGLAHSRS